MADNPRWKVDVEPAFRGWHWMVWEYVPALRQYAVLKGSGDSDRAETAEAEARRWIRSRRTFFVEDEVA